MDKKAILRHIDRMIEVRKKRIEDAKKSMEQKVKKNKEEIDELLERRKNAEEQPTRDLWANAQQSRKFKQKWNDPEFLQTWVEGSIAAGRKIRNPRLLKYIA